jgi:endonuclease/exonuclease/phosphatase family metal-dependent hydrolase
MTVTVLDNQSAEPPAVFAQELSALSDALDVLVPTRQVDRNLLIASWNIREFGGFQGTWETDPAKSPKRNFSDLHYIAEIISRFDVVAIQELQDDLSALRVVMRALGSDWALLTSDVTRGAKGRERLGYLYDVRRVRPTGLVGELVLSAEDLEALQDARVPEPVPEHESDAQRERREAREHDARFGGQLDRTPYIASFTSAGRPFMLATVHLVWGDANDLTKRAEEASLLAKMLRDTVAPGSRPVDDFRSNLIALGDFNATADDDPIISALRAAGMVTAPELVRARRTTSDLPVGPDGKLDAADQIAYDQFAYFQDAPNNSTEPSSLKLARLGGGSFPWDDYILQAQTERWAQAKAAKRGHRSPPAGAYDPTFGMSDHYPLWLELSVR